jgi:hypothetical protein
MGAKAVHPWPAPPSAVAVGFYADLVQAAVIPLACFAAIAAGWRLIRSPVEPQIGPCAPAREHVALAIGFLAFSFWVIVAARLATHAFALRYAIPSVIGASVLLGFAAGRVSRFEVEEGLRTLLRLKRQYRIRTMRGKLDWKGDLNAMRSDR